VLGKLLGEKLEYRNKLINFNYLWRLDGGWGGIRTHETLSRLPVFKTGSFNHSDTHPCTIIQRVSIYVKSRKP
jgi:hypothetical protein